MPTYQYACSACDERFERVQSFSEDALTVHEPGCGGPVRKLFGSVGVVFKGTGFYRNDSRGKTGSSESAGSSSSSDSGTTKSTETKSTETKSTPAPASTPSSGPSTSAA